MTALVGFILLFIVAAFLYLQTRNGEGFVNPPSSKSEAAPSDLNQAPITAFPHPVGTTRPIGIPGAPVDAGKQATASREDHRELDQHISIWLASAEQRERESPGSLTPEQLKRRATLHGRLADVRTQYASGQTATDLLDETNQLRRENAGWHSAAGPAVAGAAAGAAGAAGAAAGAVAGPNKQTQTPTPLSHAANPADVIADLQSICRRLAPAEPPGPITKLMTRLQSGAATRTEVESARTIAADIQNQTGPIGVGVGSWVAAYDPHDWSSREKRLCKQIREAFPRDAEALGCPAIGRGNGNENANANESENIVRLVCDRIRYSVPSVSPDQFNCP